MLGGLHTKGLSAFIHEGKLESWRLTRTEAEIGISMVSSCLWSEEWDQMPDDCLLALGDAVAVLRDLKLMLDLAIEYYAKNGACDSDEPGVQPMTLSQFDDPC